MSDPKSSVSRVLKLMFSTIDPISEYRKQQDRFVDAMDNLGDGSEAEDYSVQEQKDPSGRSGTFIQLD